METKQLTVVSLDELPQAAIRLLELGKDFPVWLFEGEMGAGKTTLIRSLCDQLGVADNVSSPTFSLVNEYLSDTGSTLYHFDFYRLEEEEEALEIGVEEYSITAGDSWGYKAPFLANDSMSETKGLFAINT